MPVPLEEHSAVQRPPSRSASTPALLPAAGLSSIQRGSQGGAGWHAQRFRWVASAGTGGHHVPCDDDGGIALHEASEARKVAQRQQRKDEMKDQRLQEIDDRPRRLEGTLAQLVSYEVNGKIYAQAKQRTPFPEQCARSHWLCQVNGMTGRYNIINNGPVDQFADHMREQELSTLRESTKRHGPAGQVQPQRDVACYDIPGFVSTAMRTIPGKIERHHLLESSMLPPLR
mmetsp:Transcript_65372/g.156300  ORF Transcript_65372/g.156300 Transcript_65372/m.156300 type:complete len:229 (+) Transcript_65372:101-787(+)